jgi:hypothetical protein
MIATRPAPQSALRAAHPPEDCMKLPDLPSGSIDWTQVTSTGMAGDTGTATARSRVLGEVQLRIVEYSAGYVADHWCDKGHIMQVLSGDLVIEYRDGRRDELSSGMSWHAPDGAASPHRVVCARGATVFIAD